MRGVLGVALVMSAAAGRAYAQSSDPNATADQLFNEGRELTRANRWAEACPKFEASLRDDPGLGTQLNLATCYEHIGKLARAWGLYRKAIHLAEKAGDVKRRDYAQTHAAGLEPRLAKLAITAPIKPPAGFVVTWDSAPIETKALGVDLYVDAGRHEIIASAPGFEAFTRAVVLGEGTAERLAIPDLTAAVAPAPDLATVPIGDHAVAPDLVVVPAQAHRIPAPGEPVVMPSSTRTYVAIGLGATGLAAAGVGFLFGVKARSSFADAKELCGARLVCDTAAFERGQQLIRDARSNATISTVLVAAGGAAVVAGVVVFLTRPKATEHRTIGIAPLAHERGAGIALVGRF